jgi:CDP-glucose 4,6-dehydratase
MEKRFWVGKNVLITGFAGFLGSNLTKALVSSGLKIFGLDIKAGRKDSILGLADYKKIFSIKGNVVNYKLVENTIKKNKIDVVFHLAAEAIVGECHSNPLGAFSTNIAGTWNILEVCRNSRDIKAIIIASSDKAYGSHKELPYAEMAPLQGNHPYDVSKSCADLIANAYAHTYDLPVCVTRCGNIFGPGDFNFSRIIPDAMRCLSQRKTLQVRSDGRFVRDYVYVDDVVDGYLRIAELLRVKKLSGESFNLSNEHPLTVVELLRKINDLHLCGNRLNYKILGTAKYEIKQQYLSSVKARRVLGWKPAHNLSAGLKMTAGWYFNNFSK